MSQIESLVLFAQAMHNSGFEDKQGSDTVHKERRRNRRRRRMPLLRRQDALRTWLTQNGYWVFADGSRNAEDTRDRPLTHVFYDGGRASVPPGPPRARFLEVYADALAAGHKPRMAEMTPPDAEFHAFADLDTKHSEGDDDLTLASQMLRVFRDKGGPRFSRAVVCTKKSGARGVHVVWLNGDGDGEGDGKDDRHHVPVSGGRMRELREACVRELGGGAWGHVFDAAVYSRRQATLRMAFSRPKEGDDHYVPRFLWRERHGTTSCERVEEADVAANLHVWVRRCSILPVAEAPVVTAAEEEGEEERDGVAKNNKKKTTLVTAADGEMRARIEGLLKLLPAPHRSSGVTSLTEGDYGFLLGLDSRFCHNLGREHKSNRVYLQIDGNGVGQRCYCTCDTTEGREFGRCADVNLPLCEHGAHPFSDLVEAKAESRRVQEQEQQKEEEKKRRTAAKGPATVLQAVDAMRERLKRKRFASGGGGGDDEKSTTDKKKGKNKKPQKRGMHT